MSVGDFLWNVDIFIRDEDQKANANGRRVSQTYWLDGERYRFLNSLIINFLIFILAHWFEILNEVSVLIFLFGYEFMFLFVGVYDALQKKYLKTLLFCVCETIEGPMIEEYTCKAITKVNHQSHLIKSD